MEKVYTLCLILGIVIPLLGLVGSLFDDVLDFSLDLFEFDIGDFCIDFLPISTYSLCIASTLFGGLGLFISWLGSPLSVTNLISGVCAYVGAVLTQSLVKFLKRHESLAETADMMLARDCTLVAGIEPDKLGSVLLDIEGSSSVQYTAKNIDTVKLSVGDKIELVDIVDDIVLIKRKVSLEDKYKD